LTQAQINLASGTTGTTTGVAQSFNETRGVDVTVVAHADISLISMTLNGFFCGQGGTATAYVGARIYDINTAQLLASGMDTVSNVYGGSVTVQIRLFCLQTHPTDCVSFVADRIRPQPMQLLNLFHKHSLILNQQIHCRLVMPMLIRLIQCHPITILWFP
jgi:hypothetical protein